MTLLYSSQIKVLRLRARPGSLRIRARVFLTIRHSQVFPLHKTTARPPKAVIAFAYLRITVTPIAKYAIFLPITRAACELRRAHKSTSHTYTDPSISEEIRQQDGSSVGSDWLTRQITLVESHDPNLDSKSFLQLSIYHPARKLLRSWMEKPGTS